MILLGNIVALLGSIMMVYIGVLKSKKKILIVQSIQISLFILSNILLGGITGVIVNVIGLIKNIYCYYGKLKLKEKIIFSSLIIILSVVFNNLGIIGILPVLATVVYIWLMNTNSITKFKGIIIFSSVCWLIYDILIKSYSSAIFDFLTIITSLYSIKQLKKKRKH